LITTKQPDLLWLKEGPDGRRTMDQVINFIRLQAQAGDECFKQPAELEKSDIEFQ
jgi:hypothetical protein